MPRLLTLFLLLAVLLVSASNGLPIFKVNTSSYYQLGLEVGMRFASNIKIAYQNDTVLPHLLRWVEREPDLFNHMANTQAKYYPNYYAELEGIAAGSGWNMTVVLLENLEADLLQLFATSRHERDKELSEIAKNWWNKHIDRCSDALIYQNNGFVHGHNEDDSPWYQPLNYILEVSFNASGSSQPQSWWGYTYAGQLAGNAFGFNSFGLSFSMNSLYPLGDPYDENQLLAKKGVSQYFVLRDMLEATSLSDAIYRLTRYPVFTGYSVNIGSLNDRTLVNIETGPRSYAVSRVGTGGFEGELPHFNNYVHLNQTQEGDASSKFRLYRFHEMSPISTPSQVIDFLGDTENTEYPVYRNGTWGILTISTAIFDFEGRTASIFEDNPKYSDPVLVLNF